MGKASRISYADGLVRIERCPLCGTTEQHVLFKLEVAIPVTAVVCGHCALIYLREMLPEEAAERFYKSNDYRSLIYGNEEQSLKKLFKQQFERAAPVIEFINSHVTRTSNPRLLDIGCSSGGFIKRFTENGYEASGVEPSEKYSAFGRKRGADIHCTTMEEFEGRNGEYDIITVVRTLNHFERVDAILGKIHKLLHDRGYLYLEVFDFHHAIFRKRLDKCLKIDHPIMFTPDTIKLFLQKTGFEIVAMECDFERKIDFESLNHMHVIAKKCSPTPVEELNIRPDAVIHAKLTALLRISNYHATRPVNSPTINNKIRTAVSKFRFGSKDSNYATHDRN